MFRILIVEDNKELNQMFCRVLTKHGYQCYPAFDGEEALDLLDREFIDLIITDIMMPHMDGFSLIRSLREANIVTPALMITAKDGFSDMREGFSSGADDYMVKPVNMDELVLRVGALLRRAKIVSERQLTIGQTLLAYDTLTVFDGRTEQQLPQKEFQLLYKLASSPGRIFTRQQIMDDIWGMESETDPRTVDVHINRLRDRFRDVTDFEIITVRGLGYKLARRA